jgi:hypothetical protein
MIEIFDGFLTIRSDLCLAYFPKLPVKEWLSSGVLTKNLITYLNVTKLTINGEYQ